MEKDADLFAPHDHRAAFQRWVNEGFGTFLLVIVDCGGAVIAALDPAAVPPPARAVATGLVIMSLVYALGNVSGAHFNPVVTLAFALRRVFPWRLLPGYWLAQLAGACLACLVLRALFGTLDNLGATRPHFGELPALVMEILLTLLLVTVVIGTATRHRVIGANAAIAAGGAVALCGLFARPISGPSMNPTRSLAPALVSGELSHLWIYLVGPLVGAVAAVAISRVVHRRVHSAEQEAAGGGK